MFLLRCGIGRCMARLRGRKRTMLKFAHGWLLIMGLGFLYMGMSIGFAGVTELVWMDGWVPSLCHSAGVPFI